ncbi:hemagglutinin repeat-containing protein [Alysiella crassa]|uniref:hemagglutinin repeat-containing protein n=2 Tax=Alysiella crassa TaxID=153491 RepID=UPI001FE7ABB8|nr:hemagglutinin repeat-containing protein [Alysiella crassa]
MSGGTSTLIATGVGKESDINITGSDVLGGKGTRLFADDAINLTSAQQHSTENSNNKSSGWNVGGSIGSQGWGVTAGGNKGKGHGNGESLTHRHTQVGDSNSATVLQSGGQTTIKGAQTHGKGIDLSAQDLLIESVQDTAKFNSKQENISGQVTIGGGASVSGSYNKSKVNADHASVNQQSGIYAGDDGYRAHVTKHTDLKGGLITSTAKAEADGKNQFSTNSLSHSDIENHSDYNAKGMGVSGGFGFNADFGLGDKAAPQSSMKATDEKGNVITDANGNAQLATGKESLQSKGKSIGYGSDGESERSVTQSGINTKNIQIQQDPTGELAKSVYTDITTETAAQHSGSLNNVFDKDKVQQEIDLQVKVSQDFNRNVQAANGEINKQIDKLKQQLDKGQISQAEYNRKISHWQQGSVLLNSIAAGLGAPTDSVAGIATATLAPAVSYQIGQEFKKNNEEGSLKHILAHAVLGAVVAKSGGNNTLAGALSAGGAEALAPKVAEYLYGKKSSELNAEQKETVSSIMSFAGAATGAAVGDTTTNAVQGSLNAESAVENNAFLFEERGALVEELRKSPQSKHNEIIEKYRKYGKEKAEQDFALCLGKGDKCHLDAIEKLRNINTQSEVFLRSLAVESEIKSAALLTIKLNNEEISWHQSQLSVWANSLDKAIQISPALVGIGTIAGSKLITPKIKTEVKNYGQTQKTMSPVDGETTGSNKPIKQPTTLVSPEMEKKILYGERTVNQQGNVSNRIIGAHSGNIDNSLPNYAVETISHNPDGTRNVKLILQFSDGNISKIKASTLFPSTWSDKEVINAVKSIGNTIPVASRVSDGHTLHQGYINGVGVEVIKQGNNVISGYPAGKHGFTNPTTFK